MISTPQIERDARIDYDLHGFLRIRLLGAGPQEAAAVERQLGLTPESLAGEPDIVIRFQDHLPTDSSLRLIGVSDAGFSEEAFFVLRSKHKSAVKVCVPFDRIGQQCEITCERGLPAVPLLIPIINLTALAKGIVPIHASAFNFNGTGVLVTGWAKGGKTETLLGFMAKGAEYVGDEWIYISPDGKWMYGIPEPIRLWDWHLREAPLFWSRVSPRDRVRLGALGLAVRSIKWAGADGGPGRHFALRGIRRVVDLLERQRYLQMPPRKLFASRCGSLRGALQKVVFVASHQSPDITIRPANGTDLAGRIVHSLQEERANFLSYYRKYRFSFPERANELIDGVEDLERQRLTKVLDGKDAYALDHPYPVAPEALFETIKQVL